MPMWNTKPEPPAGNPLFLENDCQRIDQPVNVSSYKLARRDENDVLSEAKVRLIYGQDEAKIVKYLVTELDITSDEAERRLMGLRGKLRVEFSKYIESCVQDNIMILKTMLTTALEKNDIRSATEIMKSLDNMTVRYMEDNGLIEHKEKQQEIEVKFT